MGPIACSETSVRNYCLTLEDGADMLYRNVGETLLLDPWKWDRYVVPKRRWESTAWPLKMGPIACSETSVRNYCLTLEDGTLSLSRNVGKKLLLDPWRWGRYVVPKRRWDTTVWPLKMGPICCHETSVRNYCLTLEDGTDMLFRNFGNKISV